MLASELKGELARIIPARSCCRRAELAGLTYAEPMPGVVRTLDHATARLAVQLAASLGAPVPPSNPTGASVPTGAAQPRGPSRHPGRHHLKVVVGDAVGAWSWDAARSCDRRSFLRGALLASSISFTPSGPHLEFVLHDRRDAVALQGWLVEMEVRSARIQRRGRQVVYVKGLDQLTRLLQLAGASRAVLDLESERVAGDVRSRLNRLLNAEEANLARTVRAADRQLRAVAELSRRGELDRLPQGLREAAAERRLQPDADLDTLASSLGLSRSAVNHRLRRLVLLAEEEGQREAAGSRR